MALEVSKWPGDVSDNACLLTDHNHSHICLHSTTCCTGLISGRGRVPSLGPCLLSWANQCTTRECCYSMGRLLQGWFTGVGILDGWLADPFQIQIRMPPHEPATLTDARSVARYDAAAWPGAKLGQRHSWICPSYSPIIFRLRVV